jgi:hypothetical protein
MEEKHYKCVKLKKYIISQESFPRKFPFSSFVPRVYGQANAFITDCVHFMEDLQLAQSEVSDTVRRYTNLLFARWSEELKHFVAGKKPSLIQVFREFLFQKNLKNLWLIHSWSKSP